MKTHLLTRSMAVLAVLSALLSGCRFDDPDQPVLDIDRELEAAMYEASGGVGKNYYLLPSETDYGSIPQDPRNPITTAKVELGKMLFHETALAKNAKDASGMGTYSCASCHHAGAGFQAGRVQGIGDGGIGFGFNGESRIKNWAYPEDSVDVQPVRSPSALNIAYQECVLWNGQFGATGINANTAAQWAYGTPIETNHLGYHGTETQAIAGLKVHRMVVDSSLLTVAPDYGPMFDAAFPSIPAAERISRETAGLAIAAYERTLLPNRAPFQRYLKGDFSALSSQEKNGAYLFFSKGECYTCHNGPALSSMEFHGLGMANLAGPEILKEDLQDAAHKGRGGFTGQAEDMHKFKVPQLYNLKDSPFYGHGGTFSSVYSVIRYKNAAVPQDPTVPASQLADGFHPLNLSDAEIRDIAAFIESGLHDDALYRYVPTTLPSGNCFPNADQPSRADLNCN